MDCLDLLAVQGTLKSLLQIVFIYLYLTLHISFFLFFLAFHFNIFVSFIFIALFPSRHLALVLFSSFCFSQFCSGRHNFWLTLFTRSIQCTLFLLDCFDFAYGCIRISVYSVTLYCCYKTSASTLGFCSSVEFSFFFLFFFLLPFFFLFFIIFIFKPIIFFSTFTPLFAFPTVLFPLPLIFNVYKSSSTSI